MQIQTSATRSLTTRTLQNDGSVNWTGGTIQASDGAQFINNGSLAISGSADFNISGSGVQAKFINNGTLVVQPPAAGAAPSEGGFFAAAAPASVFQITGDIVNNGAVEQRAGATITHNGKLTGSGSWSLLDTILNKITFGLYVPKTETNNLTVSGSNGRVNIDNPAPTTITNSTTNVTLGATLVATGGGNLIATGGGNVTVSGGGSLIATGGGNLIAKGGGNVIARTGGGFASSSPSGLAGETGTTAAALFTGPIILPQSGGNLIGLTGGTFTGNMVAQSGGSVLPGNAGVIGTMTLNGGLDLQAGSFLKMDILGKVQGSGYDLLNVAGLVSFNGNLQITMTYALRTLSGTDMFTILTATSPITGVIGNLVGSRVLTNDGFGSFRVTYGTTNNLVLDNFQATALTYPLWQTAWNFASGGDSAFNAAPRGDGIPNGIKYALGMSPLTSSPELLPTVSIINVSGVQYLALNYVRPTGVNLPTDINYAVERCTDLNSPGGGWSTSGVVQQSVTPGPDAGFETVVVRSTTPFGTLANSQEFLRFRATKL